MEISVVQRQNWIGGVHSTYLSIQVIGSVWAAFGSSTYSFSSNEEEILCKIIFRSVLDCPFISSNTCRTMAACHCHPVVMCTGAFSWILGTQSLQHIQIQLHNAKNNMKHIIIIIKYYYKNNMKHCVCLMDCFPLLRILVRRCLANSSSVISMAWTMAKTSPKTY